MRIAALIVAAGLCVLAASIVLGGREPKVPEVQKVREVAAPPALLKVAKIESWLTDEYATRGFADPINEYQTARCVASGPHHATCALDVFYDTGGGPFPGIRTVRLDVQCKRTRALADDCDWFE